MTPEGLVPVTKKAESNLYTAILALALAVVIAAAAFVAYKCYLQYGTVFKMP